MSKPKPLSEAKTVRLTVVPCSIQDAKEFVAQFHRHRRPPLSGLFAVACARSISQPQADELQGPFDTDEGSPLAHCREENLEVCAVAIVGRPVARGLTDGWTAEVTRVASDGTPNACSLLYGACWRAARALGYRRIVTYTLASELGTTLKASGWKTIAQVKGRSWDCETRPRVDRHPTQDKIRWEMSA